MKPLYFKLPYPPSVNHMYKRNRHLNDRALAFRKNAIAWIWQALSNSSLPVPLLNEPLYVQIELIPPKGKRVGDGDNYFKAVCDALEHSKVLVNDKIIEDHRVIRHRPEGNGYCWVGVYPLADAPPRLTVVRADAHTAG